MNEPVGSFTEVNDKTILTAPFGPSAVPERSNEHFLPLQGALVGAEPHH